MEVCGSQQRPQHPAEVTVQKPTIFNKSPSFNGFHSKKHHHKGAGDPLGRKYPIHGPPQALRRQVRQQQQQEARGVPCHCGLRQMRQPQQGGETKKAEGQEM